MPEVYHPFRQGTDIIEKDDCVCNRLFHVILTVEVLYKGEVGRRP